jgi:hypothetical protein
MKTRFHVDLLHPGSVTASWGEWFTGPKGVRHAALVGLGCVGVLVLVLATLILPTYWRLSSDLNEVPRLQRDLTLRDSDLGVLRSNLRALADEAQRQVRWAEVLTAIGQQIPATVKLQVVEGVRTVPPMAAGQPAGAAARPESTLRIDAVTPLRPGSPALLEVAQFMAGLMRDPAVNKRFRLKSWEVKPPTSGDAGVPLLNISIVLAERA